MAALDPRWELYGITDQASAAGRDDAAVSAALIRGGVSCLQYRAKKVDARQQWDMAVVLRQLTLAAGIPLVINDRIDLALDCGADGVHLGQDDLPIASARRLARAVGRSDLLVGRSTHSLDQALEAEQDGADYIGYGPLYATQTKENNVAPVGVASLGEIIDAVSIPVVAIGGIKLERLQAVADQGAQHCAIVTALTGAGDIEAAVRQHRQAWVQAKARRARP